MYKVTIKKSNQWTIEQSFVNLIMAIVFVFQCKLNFNNTTFSIVKE